MNAEHPAFPTTPKRDESGKMDPDCYPGVSIRTYIATKAMAAVINAEYSVGSARMTPDLAAMEAVNYADALIKELSKS